MKRSAIWILVLAAGCVCAFAAGETESKPAVKAPAMEKITYSTYWGYQVPEAVEAFQNQFKKDTGVTLEVISVAKDRWQDKIAAMFVSGDAADCTLLEGATHQSLSKQGYLAPLDAYIDKHPGFMKLKVEKPQVFRGGLYMGKTTGMAASEGAWMNFWVRQDWLDKLGLKMPQSTDAITAMLVAFKNNASALVPAGKVMIPMTVSNSVWPHDVLSLAWGCFNEVTLKDGKFQDFNLTPEFKEYLDWMRDLYARGLLDKEMPTIGYGDVRNRCGTGVAGSCVMWEDTGDSFMKGMQDNKIEGRMVPVPPFKTQMGVFGLSYDPPTVDYGINAKARNPEFVFNTFFDWFFMQDGGIIASSRGVEGFDFTVVDGVMKLTGLKNSGVGYHGQKFPPVKTGWKYPFRFDPISQREYDDIMQVREWAQPFFKQMDKVHPTIDNNAFWAIEDDLYSKKGALVGKYIMGAIDYAGYTAEYTRYIKEVGLPQMLADMNK
jgi:putative aldouronate transport system substrate-binding protein